MIKFKYLYFEIFFSLSWFFWLLFTKYSSPIFNSLAFKSVKHTYAFLIFFLMLLTKRKTQDVILTNFYCIKLLYLLIFNTSFKSTSSLISDKQTKVFLRFSSIMSISITSLFSNISCSFKLGSH